MKGIRGSINNIRNKTGDHGEKMYIEDSDLFFINYGAAYYIAISDHGEKKFLGDYRSVQCIYKYRYNGEFFVCLEAPNLERLKNKDHRTLIDGININKNYHIVHPSSRSVISVDRLPDKISGDTMGNIVFADVDQGSRFGGNDNECLTIFDKNSLSFIENGKQLEPASDDKMNKFEDADKIKELLDVDDKGFVSSLVNSIKGNSSIDKNDVFDAVPNTDLRKAHNDKTIDQHLSKVLTSSNLDKEDLILLIPGIGETFNTSRPDIDLRDKHLEFMKSDEYRKILKSAKYVMESGGQSVDDVKKLQEVSNGLKDIESASSLDSSDLDMRDIQTLNQLINEIRQAKKPDSKTSNEIERDINQKDSNETEKLEESIEDDLNKFI